MFLFQLEKRNSVDDGSCKFVEGLGGGEVVCPPQF